MKRFLAVLFSVLFVCMVLPVPKTQGEEVYIEYLEDGSYFVTTIAYEPTRSASSRTATKTRSYYSSSNVLLFSLTVHGTFRYDGSTSTCTDASFTYQIYDDSWHFKSGTASKSGATATASATFVNKLLGITIATKTLTPTLTCDKNGELS